MPDATLAPDSGEEAVRQPELQPDPGARHLDSAAENGQPDMGKVEIPDGGETLLGELDADSELSGEEDVGPDEDPGPDATDAPTPEAVDAGNLDTATQDGKGELFQYPWTPDGACGMTQYAWLPSTAVGELLEWEEKILYHLTPDLIAMLLAEAGYSDLIQPVYGTRVFLIRYTTQDKGTLQEATAMIGVPDVGAGQGAGDGGTETFPTMLFLHPTVGYADKCAPSGGLEGAAAALLPASLGYIGIAPDLLGLCGKEKPCGIPHPYLIGEPTALASWDAVRAGYALLAQLQDDLGVAAGGKVAIMGASQGGHAAMFVNRYAPIYAPEFDAPCTIALVPPMDLAGQAAVALGELSSAASLGTAFMAAAWLWYAPEIPASDLFNAAGPIDYAAHIPSKYPETCNAGDLLAGAQTIQDVYNPAFLAAVAQGGIESVTPFGCWAVENSVPSTSAPFLGSGEVLVLLGEKDELVDFAVEQQSVTDLCAQGYRIRAVGCAGATHFGTAEKTISFQFNWIQSCLAGEKIPDDELCVIDEPVDCTGL